MRKRDQDTTPRIDGYTIEEQIGSGGFSKVYRGIQHRLDRPVAIKILNTGFADERQQRTFERECRVMGQLSTHGHIVTVYDSGVTSTGHPCIIMELCHGTFRDQGVLPAAQVISVGAKVADALQAVHDEGIAHRDIKPHNVFISDRGEPAIGDFGISSLEDERTITGSAGFSVNYAAPEVFEEGGAGTAGDIYALGATLYHLAAGEVPFPHHGDPSDRLRSTIHRIITEPAPSLGPNAPEELDRLLRRCMAKAPSDRPRSAGEIAGELRRIAGAQPAPASTTWEPRIASPRDLPDDPSSSDSLTFVRSRDDEHTRVRDEPQSEESHDHRRRGVIIGTAAAALLVIVGIVSFAVAGGGDDGDENEPQPTPTSASAVFVDEPDLVPVEDFTAEALEDTIVLNWTPLSGDLQYRVTEETSGGDIIVPAPPVEWSPSETERLCFQVQTLNEDLLSVDTAKTDRVCVDPAS